MDSKSLRTCKNPMSTVELLPPLVRSIEYDRLFRQLVDIRLRTSIVVREKGDR